MSPTPASTGFDALRQQPLQASGLPPRVLAALRLDHRETIGDLGASLAPGGKLDADNRALLDRVADWCSAAANGAPPILNLTEWLALFLPPRLVDAVQLHFALRETTASIALHESTLRDTGFKLGVTRERARQLLRLAFDTLRQPLPLLAAEPLFRHAENMLLASGGVLDAPTLAPRADAEWGGVSPVGALLLLSFLQPERIIRYRNFFSAFSSLLVDNAEKALRDQLAASGDFLPVSKIAADLPPAARPPAPISAAPLVLTLLRHLPDTLATCDGRAGLAARDGARLLRETLADLGESPLRILVETFNQRLYPECRRGSGYVRDALQRDPLVRKTAPGRYALPGGLQTDLPLDP